MRQQNNLQNSWLKQDAQYSNDTLLIKGYQVMQSWEDPYMKDLASVVTQGGGTILELGFGLGISAGYIQRYKIEGHIIIEAHPEVVKKAFQMFNQNIQSKRMNVLQGFWEDITPLLKSDQFDGILFDTSPLNKETVFFHYFPFFSEAYRLLKKNGVFTYFSDEPNEISNDHRRLLNKAGFSDKNIHYRLCRVDPPKTCRYWNNETIVTPIVSK